MIHLSATYVDLYQLSMAQVYYRKGKNSTAVFDYYFRKNPFNGGYTIFAGLENLLSDLTEFHFTPQDVDYLRQFNFDSEFLNYLKNFRFTGNIYAAPEGDLIFPTRPILQVEANIIEAQILETWLLNILNYQSLIATKASRMRQVAGNKLLLDMGLRRAHGFGGYHASRAAMIGGFDGTSNVKSGMDFDIPVSGTMAHSFVQSYDSELEAFRDFAKVRPQNCILLVDTYNTLKSGVPNAITVAKEMEERGHKLYGIRLDSGDLAYLAKKARKKMDQAGLSYVKIVASNQLDEFVIKSLGEQDAPIDIFGVGTSLVVGRPDAALDGVYKLTEYNGKPRIKISENIIKTSIPSLKQVYRIIDENGSFFGMDVIAQVGEKKLNHVFHPFEPLKSMEVGGYKTEPILKTVVKNGEVILKPQSVSEISKFRESQLNKLPMEYKRFDNPHIYKVSLSQNLKEKRDFLITKHKK